jgi:glutaredoxin 3
MSIEKPNYTVEIYTKAVCPYCVNAKNLFDSKGISYTEYRIDQSEKDLTNMLEITGRRTVPQIIINGTSIGGFDDLFSIFQAGKLDEMLNDVINEEN